MSPDEPPTQGIDFCGRHGRATIQDAVANQEVHARFESAPGLELLLAVRVDKLGSGFRQRERRVIVESVANRARGALSEETQMAGEGVRSPCWVNAIDTIGVLAGSTGSRAAGLRKTEQPMQHARSIGEAQEAAAGTWCAVVAAKARS